MSMVCALFILTIVTMPLAKMVFVRHTKKTMKRFVGLILSAGLLAGCAAPIEDSPAPTSTSTSTTTAPPTTSTTTTTTTTSAPKEVVDVREQVARMLMPGVVDYADAKSKLEAGVGGI